MRVLVAPDKFAGTLTAAEAAEAITAGWLRSAPQDELVAVPMADGGPGFLDALHAAVGGELLALHVRGPLGEQVPAAVLLDGRTAYVESAQACGLHLVPAQGRDPLRATTYGVGELVAAAIDAGAARVVVGLGGSATVDGGAGLLAALGAEPAGPLGSGAAGLLGLDRPVLVEAAAARSAGVELVVASDVDVPLLGPSGAVLGFGRQKGLARGDEEGLEAAMARYVESAGSAAARAAARADGAGAAGGLGYALLMLGAGRVNGVQLVMEVVGLAAAASAADLLVTGEGALDWQSLRGKVVAGVARVARDTGRPAIVLAGRVEVGRRELATAGIDAAYGIADDPAGVRAAMARPSDTLAALAEKVARTWSPQSRPSQQPPSR
jgi:glycerate kinase